VKQVDEKYGVTKGFESTMDKIDKTLGLSEKANAFSNAVHQKGEELHVNEKLDAMSAKMAQTSATISRAASNAFDSALQNQYVSSAWSALSSWGSSIAAGWNSITEEASQLYARQTGAPRNPPADSATIAEPASETTSASTETVDATPADATPDSDTVSVPNTTVESSEKPTN